MSSFFFHAFRPRLDLHSFPTRRSSDLLDRTQVLLQAEALDPAQRGRPQRGIEGLDRKSTRLNSSHVESSYAVFSLEKKERTAADPARFSPCSRSAPPASPALRRADRVL